MQILARRKYILTSNYEAHLLSNTSNSTIQWLREIVRVIELLDSAETNAAEEFSIPITCHRGVEQLFAEDSTDVHETA